MLEKTYNPADIEEGHYQKWEESGVFACQPESGKDPYCVMIPPPNVTGNLHMGHALNYTLQDVLVRYNRLLGKDTLWQPGTDHAGIATQMVVERQLGAKGQSRHDLGREKFVEKIWEWKEESGGNITRQLRRLGASVDWDRERFTMDEGLNKAVRKVFVTLYKEGLIYRNKRLVNWDPKLKTAISDLEVEQRETTGKMWYFRYPVEGQEGRFITVGTTRPETMLGDTAIAVGEEDERYQDVLGKNCILPIANRPIKIVADEHADPEKGTGAVKITPAHDFNDFEVGKRHNLEMINIFDDSACMNENTPERYQGMPALEAREKIVAEMEELGLLEKIEENPMVVPYGDRSGVIIEPWLTDQWFLDAETLAKPAIEAVETGKVQFVPKNWENTYFEWMRNIQPWCISRQLWWGHQIPVWYGEDGEIFCEENEEAAHAAAEKHYGKKVELTRETDVLDTWFSSGLWPFSTLGWPENTKELEHYYPTDVLVTGFDIIFFWVARMMMMGLHFMKDIPFKTIYIHALVRDENGQKMSKSKGNVVDPLEIIEKYGADALRFTMSAMAAQGRDVIMSESRVQGYRNFATKLWNAARFTEMNECRLVEDFDPSAVKSQLAKWIISKTAEAADDVTKAIEGYRFNEAANSIYHFAWGTFCDWYLEFSKPRLNGDDAEAKAEIQATTAWVLDQILILLHPFMPYVTEELWQNLTDKRDTALIRASWPTLSDLRHTESEDEMDWVVNMITAIRSVRSEMNVPPSARIPMILARPSDLTKERLARQEKLIAALARLESIEVSDDMPETKGAAQIVVGEATVFLPLAGVIDLDQEKARLEKEIKKLDGELMKIEKKLSNQGFLAKAPESVVEEQKRRRDEMLSKKGNVEEAMQRLAAL